MKHIRAAAYKVTNWCARMIYKVHVRIYRWPYVGWMSMRAVEWSYALTSKLYDPPLGRTGYETLPEADGSRGAGAEPQGAGDAPQAAPG